MNIRFLQISDIHFHHQDFDSIRMRDGLINYLNNLKYEKGFDFLLITGDIADKGKEYSNEIKTFIKKIINETEVSIANVYIIPGNHDIVRNETRSLIINGILNSDDSTEKLDNINKKTYESLIDAQSNFFNFYKEILDKDYPVNELHFFNKTDNYNVFSINTCLISDNNGEEGSLLIGKKKLYEAFREFNKNSDTNKLNIAIGHHTLECINPKEKDKMLAIFEDAKIDLYVSGHVHDPNYCQTINSNSYTFLELISGAIVSDNYATPGFVVVDINLDNGESEASFHIWNSNQNFWAKNNQVNRGTKTGSLGFTLTRLSHKKNSDELKVDPTQDGTDNEDIDENEFKQFIIDFHEQLNFKGPLRSNVDHKIELDKKFYNMKCSGTFQKMFDKYSEYFGIIYNIMDSTSYVSSDKKDLVAEVIIDKYLEVHNNYDIGDEIFKNIVDQIILENKDMPYSKLKTQRYIKILTAWSIYECDIFNEDKRFVKK